jgi:hypothetical protein
MARVVDSRRQALLPLLLLLTVELARTHHRHQLWGSNSTSHGPECHCVQRGRCPYTLAPVRSPAPAACAR